MLALQGLDLTVKRGELMAVIGKSGSGKSTLMNIIGGLEVPSAGRIEVDNKNLSELSEREMVKNPAYVPFRQVTKVPLPVLFVSLQLC